MGDIVVSHMHVCCNDELCEACCINVVVSAYYVHTVVASCVSVRSHSHVHLRKSSTCWKSWVRGKGKKLSLKKLLIHIVFSGDSFESVHMCNTFPFVLFHILENGLLEILFVDFCFVRIFSHTFSNSSQNPVTVCCV